MARAIISMSFQELFTPTQWKTGISRCVLSAASCDVSGARRKVLGELEVHPSFKMTKK
jgi:hypothetical protein